MLAKHNTTFVGIHTLLTDTYIARGEINYHDSFSSLCHDVESGTYKNTINPNRSDKLEYKYMYSTRALDMMTPI